MKKLLMVIFVLCFITACGNKEPEVLNTGSDISDDENGINSGLVTENPVRFTIEKPYNKKVRKSYTQDELKNLYETKEKKSEKIFEATCDMDGDGKKDKIELTEEYNVLYKKSSLTGQYEYGTFDKEPTYILKINDLETRKIKPYIDSISFEPGTENILLITSIYNSYTKDHYITVKNDKIVLDLKEIDVGNNK